MQEAVTITEDHDGVPRVIGDLLLAYYDSADMKANIRNAVLSAWRMSKLRFTSDDNPHSTHTIQRYFIITCGEAIVGNIGGIGSAREITALGSCVNKASRIDEYSKLKLVDAVNANSLLVCQESAFLIAEVLPDLEVNQMDCSNQIRDFANEDIGLVELKANIENAIEKSIKKAS